MAHGRFALLLTCLLVSGCGAADRVAVPPAAAPVEDLQANFETAPSAGTAPVAAEPRPEGRFLTARIARRTYLRDAPDGRRLARLGRRTEFGSPHVLAVLRERDGWLKVISARLTNEQRGWIPVSAARLGATDYKIVVDLSERQATLKRGDRVVRRMTVAIGRPGNETPLGRFAVTDKVRPTDPTSPYGCCAVALSGHQTKLVPGWPGGDRLAIHATPQPELIGRAVSLGCLRAHDADIAVLMRRVPLGAPVIIRD